MIRTPFVLNLVVLVLSLTVLPIGRSGELQAQASGTTGHEHLTEVACVDTPPGEKRPEFGCFNIGTVKELQFSQPAVYWHLSTFGSRKAAEAAGSCDRNRCGGRRPRMAFRIWDARHGSAWR